MLSFFLCGERIEPRGNREILAHGLFPVFRGVCVHIEREETDEPLSNIGIGMNIAEITCGGRFFSILQLI
jgi:hypothetical protein